MSGVEDGDRTAAPRLAIVIVSFNTRRRLEACLRALGDAASVTRHEIVVIDNGSGDGSPDAVAAGWPEAHLVRFGANTGFAHAANVGMRRSGGELVLLLNSDAVAPPGSIDRLVAALDADETAAVAGPRILAPDGSVELSFGRMITPWNELRQKVLARVSSSRLPLAARWTARRTARTRYVDWVSGACLLARRRDAEAVGFLDERFFLYTEDVDFCAAIRARGRRVLFTPAAEIVHARGSSRRTDPAAAQAAYRRSHLAFYAKHHPRWLPLLRAWLRVRGELPPPDAAGPP